MDAELRMELNLRSGLRCRVWHAVGNRQFGLGLAGPLECGVWDVKLKGSVSKVRSSNSALERTFGRFSAGAPATGLTSEY